MKAVCKDMLLITQSQVIPQIFLLLSLGNIFSLSCSMNRNQRTAGTKITKRFTSQTLESFLVLLYELIHSSSYFCIDTEAHLLNSQL